MKKIFMFLMLIGSVYLVKSQITIDPSFENSNASSIKVKSVSTWAGVTSVIIDASSSFHTVGFSPNTYLEYVDTESGQKEKVVISKLIGIMTSWRTGEIIGRRFIQLGEYHIYDKYELLFPPLPNGVNSIDFIEPVRKGFVIQGIHINTVSIEPIKRIATTENEIRNLVDSSHSHISGFYEMLSGSGYKLATVKIKESIYLVYVGHDGGNVGTWKVGEVKAILKPTAMKNIFKADWFGLYKDKTSAIVTFDAISMVVKLNDSLDVYYKMGGTEMIDPSTGMSSSEVWTGTGFAIGDGYVVTNSHVVDEAKIVNIKGVNGDMNTKYTAEVVATDKVNDIVVLKIRDSNFKGFGVIPYGINYQVSDVGEDILVLGYPLTQALGNEIKLTNGIISSRTGYKGEVSTYQMSAPVQPGNSGGPMFDSKGDVIGIVVAGVPGADNVGYAIKTSYLKILIESTGLNIKLPHNNTLSTLSLAEKVKRLKDFVFYIECSK